jgi:choline dehydrogenase-like flavoprotein
LDENYQTYLNRAVRLTLPETYRSQVQHIQESPKFQLNAANKRQAAPFPGYTIVTPPGNEDAKNAALHESLTQYQQQLLPTLGDVLFVPVPPESFHLTLADLIWDSAYRDAIQENSEFEVQLQNQIATIFRQSEAMTEGKPLQFQALGLMVMPRAIAVCLVPADEHSYDRVLKLRRAVFQNSDLIGLGIEQQYYFTPPYPSTHNLGTCRMSANAKDGVCNKWGQTHDISNLFISDGSQFTTGGAENPTLTIVTLAIRQADYIARQMTEKAI